MGAFNQLIVGMTIAFSYTLFGVSPLILRSIPQAHREDRTKHSPPGNAITQSYMSVPALLVDFPSTTSPNHAGAARLLGRQWPVFWEMGNVFFRPISTFGIFGYAWAAYIAASAPPHKNAGDWRLYALASTCHFVTVVHSAVNLQPINGKIDALKHEGISTAELEKAEGLARRWAKLNQVRIVMPLVAGTVALSQALGGIRVL